MLKLSSMDGCLLAVATFVAVVALVRLMRQRRDHVVEELSWQAEIERRKITLERSKEERRQALDRLNRQGR